MSQPQPQPDLAALVALLDRQAISDCLVRYARGVDRLDQDLIRSAFWEDAHDAHGQIAGTVDDFLASWWPRQSAREVAQHLLANQAIELGVDAADVETYFLAVSKPYDDNQLEIVGGRYLDRFAKRAGEWRIKDRLVILDWQCVTDASGMAERLSRANRGSRGQNDPSYRR